MTSTVIITNTMTQAEVQRARSLAAFLQLRFECEYPELDRYCPNIITEWEHTVGEGYCRTHRNIPDNQKELL